jgi:hypothetical protein
LTPTRPLALLDAPADVDDYNDAMPLLIWAILAASAMQAQAAHVENMGVMTQVMSPTVVASWYVQQETDGSNRLQLLVLWRGTPAWWRQPGCIGSCGNKDYTVQYGPVQLSLRYDPARASVTVNGHDIALRDDNVLYVDSVDGPGGVRLLRTSHIEPHIAGAGGQIGTMLGNSHEILDYMQCGARSGIAALDARLATMCMTNLGRQ